MKDKTSFFIRGFTQSAILTFFSRISGFIRDIFIAAFLGAGIFSDIFLSLKFLYYFGINKF